MCSLHDVTPFHLPRLERAEALFAELGVAHVTYLLIPDYHGLGRADTEAFRAWCRRERPFRVDWLLHGYYHLETDGPPTGGAISAGGGVAPAATQPPENPRVGLTPSRSTGSLSPLAKGDRSPLPEQSDGGETCGLSPTSDALTTRLKRRYATAGEGEFLALPDDEARQRIERGKSLFYEAVGRSPEGFVPPAWLHTPTLPEVVRAAGLRLWEDRQGVADLTAGVSLPAPVITWATRTPFRKWTSVLGTPLLAARWRRAPVVRLAVHPFDFDHPETVASVRRVWRQALRQREAVGYHEALAEARAAAAP